MDNMQPNEKIDFLFRRLSDECPWWAIGVPVVFAFLVVLLVVIFRPEKKLIVALVGGMVVGVISLIYLPVAFLLVTRVQQATWLVILIPVMGVALFYVGLMYLRDSKSVHFLWAVLLGGLRICVYVILATVFLLPGCQHFEKQEYESKVLVLFDVSGSMLEPDDLPEPGKAIKTRQDKIHAFLTDAKGADGKSFMDRIVQNTPVTAGRFGPVLDEVDLINLHPRNRPSLTAGEWRKWLNPDKDDVPRPDVDNLKDETLKKNRLAQFAKRLDMVDTLKSGTNIGGACLQMHKLESGSMIQAIIVFSDGQSNVGSDDAKSDFLARVNSQRGTIPVITVGVGQFRMPVSIRIDDVNAPEETRPDDAFKIKVPVVSTGIPGEKFKVFVEIKRVEDGVGKPVTDKTYGVEWQHPKEKNPRDAGEGEFTGNGDIQQGNVEFEVDVRKLTGIIDPKDERAGQLEGKWEIVAKTARHPKEPFADEFHLSEPVAVQIQKRPLRVLLFAGGSTREYIFLRTILYREMNEKRMEFCIHNQSTLNEDHVDQDVPPERMLQEFPDRLGPNAAGKQFMSLSDYDVIIAFDPDWTKLSVKQRELLNKWVGENAGGLIFVAGPIFSFQLARQGGQDFSKLLPLIPVVLKDARLHGLGTPDGESGHNPTRPYALNFTPAAKQYDFLKLEEASENPIGGWNGFFFGNENFNPEPGKDYKPKRGLFTYYPVERIKTGTEVIAVFPVPQKGRIGDKTAEFKDQPPFIAAMTYGSGKSLYIGSGEFWRLRAYKDGFHERLWIKMARYVAAGAKAQKKYGRILMAHSAPVGRIDFEAQIRGKDLNYLPADVVPTVLVRKVERKNREGGAPDPKDKDPGKEKDKGKEVKGEKKDSILRFDLKAKPTEGDWQGYFYGSIVIPEPGEYEFRVPIPGVETDPLKQSVTVRKPNPEIDNKRTNFGYLYQLASPSDTLLRSLDADTKKRIESLLQAPEGALPGKGEKVTKRLYFPLASADAIADCIQPVPPKTDTIKGQFVDLWDVGVQTGWSISMFWAVLLVPIAVGFIGAIILLALRQWLSAVIFFGACVVLSLLAWLFCYFPYAALVVIGLLVAAGTLACTIAMLVQQDFLGAVILFVIVAIVGAVGLAVYFFYLDAHTRNFAESLRTDSLPLGFSFLLITAVSLVGLEWLMRKLLRLA